MMAVTDLCQEGLSKPRGQIHKVLLSFKRYILSIVSKQLSIVMVTNGCEFGSRGPFLESPGNLPGLLSIFLNVFSPITERLQTWYFANVFIEL